MSENNKKQFPYLLIFFVLLSVGLGSYIVYDKYFNNQTFSQTNESKTDELGKNNTASESSNEPSNSNSTSNTESNNNVVQPKENSTETANIHNSYVGIYKADVEIKDDSTSLFDTSNGNELLYLFSDGTFARNYLSPASNVSYGNYYISDNMLILNYLVSTSSGMGIHLANEKTTKLVINNKNLIDSSYSSNFSNSNSITFKYENSNFTEEIMQEFYIKNVLKKNSNDLINDNM